MIDDLPQYVTDEIDAFMAMDNASLLKSYKLYLVGDWHEYSETVLEEMKQELINRGITV
jgi:hypothetical protein